MKHLVATACTFLMWCSVTNAASPQAARQATFATPCAPLANSPYPHDYNSAYGGQGYYGGQPFRWGWFGAHHFTPASQTHRNYNRGWTEWQYYR